MKASEMELMTPYRVTKGSTDGTLTTGDIIWLSNNGDLNVADSKFSGWLDHDDWVSDPETNDFLVDNANDYAVVTMGSREYLVSNNSLI